MLILTLYQPYATFVALGLKRFETRSRRTNSRGALAIHAGKREMGTLEHQVIERAARLSGAQITPDAQLYPLGKIVAVAELNHCLRMVDRLNPDIEEEQISLSRAESDLTPLDLATGYWQADRFAYWLQNIKPLPEPIACRGQQGMRIISDPALLESLSLQLARLNQIAELMGGS